MIKEMTIYYKKMREKKTKLNNIKTAGWHTGILLTPGFLGVVLLVILIFFFRSGCSPFAR